MYSMPDFAGENGEDGMNFDGEGMELEGMDPEPEDAFDGPINMVRSPI